MLKKSLKFFFVFLFVLLLILISPEFFTNIYNFPKPKPFSGENWYNPYKNTDFSDNNWKIANFHAHTKAWFGITNGRNVSPANVYNSYKNIGYNIIQVSDYMKINCSLDTTLSFIPTYEHGYGITKNHHLCIGANKVNWIEYPLFQTLHHKQTVIDKIKENVDVLSIAHPLFNKANKPEDFKFLANYDLMEVLNHYCNSVSCWDSALSSGHAVFIIADDDMHDLQGKDEFGVCATFISEKEINRKNTLSALKSGNAYGVEFTYSDNDNNELKANRINKTPFLTGFTISNDTLKICLSDTAFKHNFIGQNGKLLKSSSKSKESFYVIKNTDTYIRAEIIMTDSTKIYLNPVFRYSDDGPFKKTLPEKRIFISVLLKIVIIAIWFIIIYLSAVKPYVNKKRRNPQA